MHVAGRPIGVELDVKHPVPETIRRSPERQCQARILNRVLDIEQNGAALFRRRARPPGHAPRFLSRSR